MADYGSTWEGEGEAVQQCNHDIQYQEWLYELHYNAKGNIAKLISESDSKDNLETIKILMKSIHDFVCEHGGNVELLKNIITLDAYMGDINMVEFETKEAKDDKRVKHEQ